jgi:hypothetical protein
MDDKRLLKVLVERVTANPNIVPLVLKAVSDGMAAWQAKVLRHLDHRADYAISSALGMPAKMTAWNAERHGSQARLVATGWGLSRRKPSSQIEVDLVAVVREADLSDPENAAGHYEIMGCRPIPATDAGYEDT